MSDGADTGQNDAIEPAPIAIDTREAAVKSAPKRRRKRRRRVAKPKPATRADIFAGFETELKAINWNSTIERESKIHEVIGRLIVQVALVPELTSQERERLQWVTSLARQLKDFRDTAEIAAALRKLAGEDEKAVTMDGPTLEDDPGAVGSEHGKQESSERGAGPSLRGRPRARALA
jgi:hypothetical protein